MKNIDKNSIVITTVIILVISLVIGFAKPIVVFAAPVGTAPDLGTAAPFAVFGKAGVENTGAGTHIWGDVGADSMLNITGLIASQVDGTIIAPTPAQVQTDTTAAYLSLSGQYPGEVINLAGPKTVTPGVYAIDATQPMSGTITLNGAGVYIFGSDSAYTISNGAKVVLTNGATACNVFWQIPAAITIGTTAEIVGTIISDTGLISLATGATLQGQAWSSTKKVTLDTNQITACDAVAATPVPSPVSSTSRWGTINVVKRVINDNGGIKTIADFPLFVNGASVVSGVTNNFPAPADAYTVTETTDPNYTQTFSGDCPENGRVSINPGENKFCIITNDDNIGAPVVVPPVPPLIDVVKVPSPLALPAGPGFVAYTYTLRNIGTVPVTDITMVGDTCSPINLVSGDTNGDAKLDLNETWIYNCSTTLSETHTNTVVATGWANGITATDIANATVVVGASTAPPLIHITKVPDPLTLRTGGGMVTYTKKITNPGTVALSNVRVSDDKCSPINYISGDTNGDAKLDPAETWTYTCRMNLVKTMTNTATATGEANGLIARDLAIVTVVAATAPGLPNTGFSPFMNPWGIVILAGILISFLILAVVFLKKRKI